MKKVFLPCVASVALMMASCIADEPKNSECDLESVSIHMDDPLVYLFHAYDTTCVISSTAEAVSFVIRDYQNVTSLPVTVKATAGATVYLLAEDGTPTLFRNGSSVDFSDEKVQTFRVVSEDGAWNRSYNVSVVHAKPSEGNMEFQFETYALDKSGKYYEWPVDDENAVNVFTDGIWKNGNPGYKLSTSSAKAMAYPSTPVEGGGPDGSDCVKLETMDTGKFGQMVNMRMASGSMFNGVFDVSNALKDALKATQFGSPFTHKPMMMKVWLKFTPGATYQDRNANPMAGVTDEPDAYVVFYRNEDEAGNRVQLDGNDVLSNPHIIAVGRLPHHYNEDGSDQLSSEPIHGLTPEWQEVTIPVLYTAEPDPEIMANNGYNIVIGFASSWQGAYFKGAVGSKLFIDDIRVYCE